jgi:hypothetical protein
VGQLARADDHFYESATERQAGLADASAFLGPSSA